MERGHLLAVSGAVLRHDVTTLRSAPSAVRRRPGCSTGPCDRCGRWRRRGRRWVGRSVGRRPGGRLAPSLPGPAVLAVDAYPGGTRDVAALPTFGDATTGCDSECEGDAENRQEHLDLPKSPIS